MQVSEMYAVCVKALRNYVDEAGFRDVVIGLSGGIDSALVAVMCVDALGADQVHGVLMPGPYSTAHSVDDAKALAANLCIEADTIPIIEPYEAFERVLAKTAASGLHGLAAENTQARCRMVVLMALSNTFGWLLINTGNKSESMLGYSTLYGDSAGAFAPLGGIYKSDVFNLACWRNAQDAEEGRPPSIPEHTLSKPPSAELAPGQEDEKSLGITYARLDPILIALVEQGKSIVDVVSMGFSDEEVLRVGATIKATRFKRRLDPPFPEGDFYGSPSSGQNTL